MIDKNVKLHLACAKDDLREALQYVLVLKDFMVATDAHIAAVVPTEQVFEDEVFRSFIPEEGLLIHREDWQKLVAFDAAVWKTEGEVIRLMSKKKRDMLIEVVKNGEDFHFPNWRAIIPNEYDSNPIESIGANASNLLRCQQALGLESLKMTFFAPERPILIKDARSDSGRYGIVMPVLIK
jgi:hypothetical protein